MPAADSKPTSESKAAQNGADSSAEKPVATTSFLHIGQAPAEIAYPEKDAVRKILHSAREVYLKSQFQAALDLVTQALEIDQQSPSALAMQRELVEAMKRINRHDS